MRFVYIFFDKKIIIEVQENRNKLSPFIRNKKILDNLEQNLSIEEDKIIFQFLKLLNKTNPPFEISGEFISLELLKLINKIGFVLALRTYAFYWIAVEEHFQLIFMNPLGSVTEHFIAVASD